jgi:glucose-6-phosphate 1-dehydrogenase
VTQDPIDCPPFDMTVFGGTGDLALRKLLPALYHLDREGRLLGQGRIIGTSRVERSDADYRARVAEAIEHHVLADHRDATSVRSFLERIEHEQANATDRSTFVGLAKTLDQMPDRQRVFYCSTSPSLFAPLAEHLAATGLVTSSSRVVLEKPLGHDLASSRAINDAIGQVFSEEQTYRIDHYLGKEAVQNLLVLRFANRLFEPLWNNTHVDHVQITVSETVGVENRWGYYDGAGAMRDMVQNHLLQLLCLVAMEPPPHMDQDAVRDEKVKVLSALRPIAGRAVDRQTVRGQYRNGAIDETAVPGYLDEEGANQGSHTETFVAVRSEIENWRWAGVPFYLRTGKRMHERLSEIVIQFREVPHLIFDGAEHVVHPNRLVIQLQPDVGIKLIMTNKTSGPGPLPVRFQQTPLNLSFEETSSARSPGAYERLLLDVIRGNPTLFMRRDEVDAAWRWVDPICGAWQEIGGHPKPYASGTWGPSASVALIERDGRNWHEDMP